VWVAPASGYIFAGQQLTGFPQRLKEGLICCKVTTRRAGRRLSVLCAGRAVLCCAVLCVGVCAGRKRSCAFVLSTCVCAYLCVFSSENACSYLHPIHPNTRTCNALTCPRLRWSCGGGNRLLASLWSRTVVLWCPVLSTRRSSVVSSLACWCFTCRISFLGEQAEVLQLRVAVALVVWAGEGLSVPQVL
jgi:hypothetical protein